MLLIIVILRGNVNDFSGKKPLSTKRRDLPRQASPFRIRKSELHFSLDFPVENVFPVVLDLGVAGFLVKAVRSDVPRRGIQLQNRHSGIVFFDLLHDGAAIALAKPR